MTEINPSDRLVLIWGWACLPTGRCTCGGEPPHGRMCGYEQVARIDTSDHDRDVRRIAHREADLLVDQPQRIVLVNRADTDKMRTWLKHPRGELWVNPQLTVVASGNGEIDIQISRRGRLVDQPEHIIWISRGDTDKMRAWLERPSGGLWVNDRLIVATRQNGGIEVQPR